MTTETELSKAYEPTEVEARWYALWLERNYFRAEATSSKPPFSIVLPPPNVTGSLHIGHALTATIQDVLIRWKRMSGFNCLWLPGTDHAGIATQMVVEKELKRTEKVSRHDLGRAEFLKRVWEWKDKYGKRIGEQHQVLGASLDWSRERFTMDERSSAAVREVFVRLYEEGLIYRAQKLINWCPSCRTALSDLEVEHEEKAGSLWHIRYPVKGSDRFLTVATTRPETMLGDTAVAVHPDDPRYAGLVGQSVTLPLASRDIPIIADAELVQMEFGTGVVKVTPAHDFNDYQTGLRHKLPMLSILDDAARTNKEAGAYAGLDRFEARKRVLEDLTAQGLLEKEEPHKLSVGTCQRCTTVVEPRLSPQWFVKIEPLATPAIRAVEEGKTKFVPESWTNTFFQWMRNIHDWTISRQLWWGHQIPAYYCTTCSPRQGDDTDLPLDAPTQRIGGIDYARATPIVAREQPESCPRCGGHSFEQDQDVLDTWFSSGLWPFSTLGWPQATPELKTFYPNSVMETGHDIIFFWVARMMMMGLHFMGEVPFHTVYLHAMVRDEKGEKMSKTKGNVVDPLDVIRGATVEQLAPSLKNKFPQGMPAFGADALRFTLASLTQQGRDIKLSMDRLAGYKAFSNKLWNASRFALMNMGDFRADGRHPKERTGLTLADRWILARLQRAIVDTGKALEAYQFGEAASTLYQFLWGEFCDWYIELAKGSLYGDDIQAKDNTRAVLVYGLDQILRLLHPFMPFITEEIWQKLPMERPTDSIMIAPFPQPDPRLEDAAAEAEMAHVVAAIEGLRNIRGESNLSPAQKLVAHVQSADPELRASLERWKGYLMPLAGLSQVHVSGPGQRPAQAAAYVGPGMEIYVPLAGLIDFAAERDRLTKEIARIDQDLAGILRKLDNPNFVAKAPPDVVVKDRARVEELQARRAKLQENLGRLAEPEPAAASEPDVDITVVEAPVVEAPVVPVPVVKFPVATPAVVVSSTGGGAPAPAPKEERVDLSVELKEELAAAEIPPPAAAQRGHEVPQMKADAEDELTAADHHDLGMAYMGMGLVDQAVKELTLAQKGDPSPAVKKAKRVAKKARGVAKKAVAAVKRAAGKAGAVVKKKVAAKKAQTRKLPAKKGAASKAPAKKGARAKVAVKKAATQVKAKAQVALAKGKAKAGATKAKVQAGATKVKARAAAKKAAKKRR
jgi:valyl-tRNA synthetase